MKVKEFLKFYLGYNSFQVVTESGDRWTDVLSKEEVLKSFGNAELKRTDIDGEEYICWLVLFIADKDLQWVNVNGLVANFDWREYFDVVKTPVVFILDDKNKIIAKNIQGDNIAKIMELLDEGKLKF